MNMKKTLLAFLIITSMITTLLPAFTVVAADPLPIGYKSANFNLLKAYNAPWGQTWTDGNADIWMNDGKTNTAFNHSGSANGGRFITTVFDLQTQWTPVPTSSGEPRKAQTIAGTHLDSTPYYNKAVFKANSVNSMSVINMYILHEPKASNWLVNSTNKPAFTSVNSADPMTGATQIAAAQATTPPVVVASRYLNKDKNKGISDTDLTQAFSFNKTNDRLVGFSFNVNSVSNPYTAEFEVYYVMPNTMQITANDQYSVLPGATLTGSGIPAAHIYDIDGDEILDSELTGVTWTTDAQHATINPNTGAITASADFSGSETFNITATSSVIGYETLTATKQITLLDASDPNLPSSVDISTASSLYELGSGDTITIDGGVKNSAGGLITDPAVLADLTFTMQTTCPQLSINPSTGVVTATGELVYNYPVTVTATLGGAYKLTDSVTFTVKSDKKSLNYNLGAIPTSGWSISAAINDDNFSTTSNGGNHAASTWVVNFALPNWSTAPKSYNKVAVYFQQYNTAYLAVRTATTASGSDGLPQITISDINADFKTTNIPMRQVFSFDANNTNNKGNLVLTNLYLRATSGSDEYAGKNPNIAEVQLFYVLPASVSLTANDTYTAPTVGTTITPVGKVLDVDGDQILDSAFNQLEWSVVSGGDGKVSIDPATGVLTTTAVLTENTDVTIRAQMPSSTGYSLYAEKTITLTAKQVSSIEITDIPDFIMTNTDQSSSATLYPGKIVKGHNGEILTGQPVAWSLAPGAPDGVSVTSGGVLQIAGGTPAGTVTLICTATGAGEDATGSVTFKVNEKVDLVRSKLGWTNSGYGNASVGNLVDGTSSTWWSLGGHSPNAGGYSIFNIAGDGDAVKANYFRLKTNRIDNFTVVRVAGSNSLVDYSTGNTTLQPPTVPNTVPDPLSVLAPKSTVNNALNGTNFWSGYSSGVTPSANYLQDNLITDTDMHGYFAGGIKSFKFIGITALNIVNTQAAPAGDPDKTLRFFDFEVYNTSPNYVKITLPADVNIKSSGATIPMEAILYNGITSEDKAEGSEGTWSISSGISASIDSATGVLTATATSAAQFGTITYNYSSDLLDTKTSIYVYNDNGTLKFSNSPPSMLGINFNGAVLPIGNTLYIPRGINTSQLLGYVTADNADDVYIKNVLPDGSHPTASTDTLLETHKLYVEFSGFIVTYDIRYATDSEITVAINGTTATASIGVNTDFANAELLLAEYSGSKLVRVVRDVKIMDTEILSVTLTNIGAGNIVKAMLFDSIGTIKPLRLAKSPL